MCVCRNCGRRVKTKGNNFKTIKFKRPTGGLKKVRVHRRCPDEE